MDTFSGKLAVVTGGGSGMGRELTRQLAAQGCSVAGCDLNPDTMAETVDLAQAAPRVERESKRCGLPWEQATTPVKSRRSRPVSRDKCCRNQNSRRALAATETARRW